MDQRIIFYGSVATGVVLGFTAGYFFARSRLKIEYEEAVKEEIETAKNYYSILHKRDGYGTPEEAVKTLRINPEFSTSTETMERVIRGLRYGKLPTRDENIWKTNHEDSDVDYSEEEASRSEESPYIISMEEFMSGDSEFNQVTVTYFTEDNVLADDRDDPIDEIEMVVGNDNLKKFGHRSKDARVVYIRNEKLRIDFEVIRMEGEYAKLVAGFDENDLPNSKNGG